MACVWTQPVGPHEELRCSGRGHVRHLRPRNALRRDAETRVGGPRPLSRSYRPSYASRASRSGNGCAGGRADDPCGPPPMRGDDVDAQDNENPGPLCGGGGVRGRASRLCRGGHALGETLCRCHGHGRRRSLDARWTASAEGTSRLQCKPRPPHEYRSSFAARHSHPVRRGHKRPPTWSRCPWLR